MLFALLVDETVLGKKCVFLNEDTVVLILLWGVLWDSSQQKTRGRYD